MTSEGSGSPAKSHFQADGGAVQSARIRMRWTQGYLAEKTGLSQKTIERAEAGRTISATSLHCLAEALKVDVQDLCVASYPRVEERSGVGSSGNAPADSPPSGQWRAEFVLDLDFRQLSADAQDAVIGQIMAVLRMGPSELRIRGRSPGAAPSENLTGDGGGHNIGHIGSPGLLPTQPLFGAPDASWSLVRRLGDGGFGQVWLTTSADTGESRVVKFFTHEVRRTEHARHEMRVVQHVLKHMREHPDTLANIVPLLDANLEVDPPWLMYRFVPGGRSLRDVIHESASQTLAQRVNTGLPILRTIAAAMGRMHRLKTPIVHRDLKPSNVLMDGDTPMISDFGIGGASVIGAISDGTGGHTSMPDGLSLPTHLQKSGTLRYCSPGQLAGDPPDPRDDVYSLAVVAYQVLMGDVEAAPGADTRDQLGDIGVSDSLTQIIARNLSRPPVRRQVDAGEFAASLADCDPQNE